MTEFDVLGDHLVVGNNNGTLSVWDINTAQMTVLILSYLIPPYSLLSLFSVLSSMSSALSFKSQVLFSQVSKQLFGIVTGVRCLEQEQAIVTTHAGEVSNLGGPLNIVTNGMKYQHDIRQGF